MKTLVFAILIAACFFAPAPEQTTTAIAPAALTLAGVLIALQAMVFTYDGWGQVLYFSGELNNPGRDIPRAMVMAVVTITAIYLLINAAFLHLIPLTAMAGDPLVADTAAGLVFGEGGTAFIRVPPARI
jgi:APA family basic amino acid/polyamine antiporter